MNSKKRDTRLEGIRRAGNLEDSLAGCELQTQDIHLKWKKNQTLKSHFSLISDQQLLMLSKESNLLIVISKTSSQAWVLLREQHYTPTFHALIVGDSSIRKLLNAILHSVRTLYQNLRQYTRKCMSRFRKTRWWTNLLDKPLITKQRKENKTWEDLRLLLTRAKTTSILLWEMIKSQCQGLMLKAGNKPMNFSDKNQSMTSRRVSSVATHMILNKRRLSHQSIPSNQSLVNLRKRKWTNDMSLLYKGSRVKMRLMFFQVAMNVLTYLSLLIKCKTSKSGLRIPSSHTVQAIRKL